MAKAAAKKVPAKKAATKKAAPAKKVAGAKSAGAKKASPIKVAAGDVVTLKHLAVEMAGKHELPNSRALTMLTEMIDSIRTSLKKGAKVRIVGLGILQVKKREARMGRNPATGEAIKIKASKKVAFRASKELKEAV
jgi:DNA-binding protein HU-beta